VLMADQTQRRISRLQGADALDRVVATAIIDINDFEGDQPVKRGMDFGHQRRNVLGFVLDRDDDRELQRVQLMLWAAQGDGSAGFSTFIRLRPSRLGDGQGLCL
jgi:hypothetical protein